MNLADAFRQQIASSGGEGQAAAAGAGAPSTEEDKWQGAFKRLFDKNNQPQKLPIGQLPGATTSAQGPGSNPQLPSYLFNQYPGSMGA